MATYREIHGKAIKTVTTNPSDDAAEGQIWFNSTDNTFKSIVSLEAMTSGTSMSNTRGQNGTAHNGTQNAALSVTGNNNGGGSNLVTNTSEEYKITPNQIGGYVADAETDNEKLLKQLLNPDLGVDEFIDDQKKKKQREQELLEELKMLS